MEKAQAIIERGYGVASGSSETDKRFPGGTIRMQKPFFKTLGFDMDAYFETDYVLGTLNLSIKPKTVHIKTPELFFPNVHWTDVFPAENFFMSLASLEYHDASYKALIYIPDPSTKPDHFQAPSIVELIAQTIPDLKYGESVTLVYNPAAVAFCDA